MQVGEMVAFQHREVSPGTIRANVSHLRKKSSKDFKVRQSYKEGRSTVTRIK